MSNIIGRGHAGFPVALMVVSHGAELIYADARIIPRRKRDAEKNHTV